MELAWPKRFIFAVIAVDLPAAQAAAGIHDLPSIAAKNLLHMLETSVSMMRRGAMPLWLDFIAAE